MHRGIFGWRKVGKNDFNFIALEIIIYVYRPLNSLATCYDVKDAF